MELSEIIQDLKSRGEHSINFDHYPETGIIKSKHGKNTVNYWIIKDKKLLCIDCKTIN